VSCDVSSWYKFCGAHKSSMAFPRLTEGESVCLALPHRKAFAGFCLEAVIVNCHVTKGVAKVRHQCKAIMICGFG